MKIVPALLLSLFILPFCTIAFGEDKAAEEKSDQQFLALGLARSKVELAFHKCNVIFQNQQESYYGKLSQIDDLRGKIARKIQEIIQAEKNKVGDEYNQATIDGWAKRIDEIEQQNQVFQRDRQILDSRFRAAEQHFRQVEQVFNSLLNLERPWKESEMDLATLAGVYEMVAKGVSDSQANANVVIKEAQDKRDSWQKQLEEISNPTKAPAAK